MSHRKYAGNVIVRFTVAREGIPRDVRIIPNHLQAGSTSLQEARKWRFCPAFIRGERLEKAVEFTIHIPHPD